MMGYKISKQQPLSFYPENYITIQIFFISTYSLIHLYFYVLILLAYNKETYLVMGQSDDKGLDGDGGETRGKACESAW